MYLLFLTFYLVFHNFTNSVLSWTHATPCNATQWQCDSGECINAEDRCDGMYNCADGTDEIFDHCIHLPCPAYAFRCAYGACITGNNRCNGRQDCVDNSDETDFQCAADVHELERTLQGNCWSPLMVQCRSGQCIKSEDRCDGVYDCEDRSDETVQLCSYLFCPAYAFRCGYGGCIRGSAICNGIQDCADGSDEALDLCGYDRRHKTNVTLGSSSVSSSPPPLPIKKHKERIHGCLIPFTLEATHVQNAYTKEYLQLGTIVTPGTFIHFSCDNQHVLEGSPQNECMAKSWKYAFPTCTKYCSHHTINKGISTTVSCTYDHHPINCSSYLRENTTVLVKCAAGYTLPTTRRPTMQLRCDENHEWDYPKIKCAPECGILENHSVPLSQTPWHVSIYENQNNALRRICGGTIISPKLIVTAAKCFPIFDPYYYSIVVGHQLPRLQQNDLNGKEVHNLSEIFIPTNDYQESRNDVAFATLINYFDFGKPNIMPICLQENNAWRGSFQPIMAYYRKELNRTELYKLGELDIGYALSVDSDDNGAGHKTIQGIVSEIFGTAKSDLLLINVNFYRNFIKKAIRKYRYIL